MTAPRTYKLDAAYIIRKGMRDRLRAAIRSCPCVDVSRCGECEKRREQLEALLDAEAAS